MRMAEREVRTSIVTPVPPEGHGRALKIAAKTIYRELRQNGYSHPEIVAFSTELLDLVTLELRSQD